MSSQDLDEYERLLTVTRPLVEPLWQQVIEALQLPRGSRGLDVGCGLGAQTLALVRALGGQGQVVGLDVQSHFLGLASRSAHATGFSERATFVQGDAHALPFVDKAFDWSWSADCVGYGGFDAVPPLREMARMVRPGGMVNIMAWSGEQLLPGYAPLEARLRATAAGLAPFTEDLPPERHLLRCLGSLERVGLREVRARTFVQDFQAPLSPEMREALIALFGMRWPGAEDELAPPDRELFLHLCDPASPGFVLNAPDYYGFYTYTLFQGTVPL